VITTDYPWLREFEKNYGGRFFRIDPSLKNLNWEQLLSFPFEAGDLRGWSWEEQINRSGILEWLQQKMRLKD
jgi:hypothetical protein